MKTYIKPVMDCIELRVEEKIGTPAVVGSCATIIIDGVVVGACHTPTV